MKATRRAKGNKSEDAREGESVLPLGATLPLLGGGWFLLNEDAVARGTGPALPAGLAVAGVVALAVGLWLARRSPRWPSVWSSGV